MKKVFLLTVYAIFVLQYFLPFSNARANQLTGVTIEIAGDVNAVNPTNKPIFKVTNNSSTAEITSLSITIGNTDFHFGTIAQTYQEVIEIDPGNDLSFTPPNIGPARLDEVAFSFTGFNPNDRFRFQADMDQDAEPQNVNLDFQTILFGNGTNVSNAVITAGFSNGENLNLEVEENPAPISGDGTEQSPYVYSFTISTGPEVLVFEDFESYEIDCSPTYAQGCDLSSQSDWGVAPLTPARDTTTLVALGSGLGTQVANGRLDVGTGAITRVFLPVPPPANSDVYTLTFDAYGYSSSPHSHNSGFGFTAGDMFITWQVANHPSLPPNSWQFGVATATGSIEDNIEYTGGFDKPVKFQIVLDAGKLEFFGRYDFGSGFVDGTHFPITSEQLSSIKGLVLFVDYRRPGSYLGMEVDNIILENSPANRPPIAHAGPDQLVIEQGTLVQLDGSQSFDEDGDPITYEWEFLSKPTGSSAVLSDTSSAMPTFVADVHGDYVLELTVLDDKNALSAPDQVVIGFDNIAPNADAGGSQNTIVNNQVVLDGSGSSDANLDTLSFSWLINSAPTGSIATFSNENAALTTFTPDVVGTYTISLTVDDGFGLTDVDTIQLGVISVDSAVTNNLMGLSSDIDEIGINQIKNENLGNSLINKINSILQLIENGDYQSAKDKLTNDVLKKTDGCVDINGSPDNNDWVTDCTTQIDLQSTINDTLLLLDQLL